jgi:hypothetical protein
MLIAAASPGVIAGVGVGLLAAGTALDLGESVVETRAPYVAARVKRDCTAAARI